MSRPPKILCLTSPGLGHLFPLVPSLWAARGTGARVLVGTTGAAVAGAVSAGLSVVDLCPGVDLGPLRASFLRRMPGTPDAERFALAMEMFGAIADAMADAAVDLARAWRPDLVIFTPLQAAGPLVAQALGVPCVEHGFQLTGVGQTQHLLEPHLAKAIARAGVQQLRTPEVALDICPPSMAAGLPSGWVMGYLPYNGGGEIAPTLLPSSGRPQVLFTTGTASRDEQEQHELLAVLGTLDIDVLLAGTPPQGKLPANVTAPGWIPLDTMLPSSALLVHHGGAGSALSALRAGVPQVIVSGGADHEFNAAALTRRGAGVNGRGDVTAAVRAALADPALGIAAREVAAEMAALPAPATLIPEVLNELLGTGATGAGATGAGARSDRQEVGV